MHVAIDVRSVEPHLEAPGTDAGRITGVGPRPLLVAALTIASGAIACYDLLLLALGLA